MCHHTFGLSEHCSVQQADNDYSESEKYALGHLCNWLEEVENSEDLDDAHLDESARAYLKSYRDNYSRRKSSPVSILYAR